jgi:hypothetical protein
VVSRVHKQPCDVARAVLAYVPTSFLNWPM